VYFHYELVSIIVNTTSWLVSLFLFEMLYCIYNSTLTVKVVVVFEKNWTRGGKVYGDEVKWKIEISPFHEMIKYSHRGPNLAVCFLRQGILYIRMSEEEIRVILVFNRDWLSCGNMITEKDPCVIRKRVFLGQEHFNGRMTP